jgi:hypothetical protein
MSKLLDIVVFVLMLTLRAALRRRALTHYTKVHFSENIVWNRHG